MPINNCINCDKYILNDFFHDVKHDQMRYLRISLYFFFNSSPPSTVHMSQWTWSALVQIMACRLIGTKPLPELLLTVDWTCRNKFQRHFNQNSNILIQENIFKNVVCEMATILSSGDELTELDKSKNCNWRYLMQIPIDNSINQWRVTAVTSMFIISRSGVTWLPLWNWEAADQSMSARNILNI